ncbi:MAG: hypothetical protein FJ279_25725 [Planctomycetes bacterium]|nr:hypothetical protein [Planctomycetota bacterium]
MAAAGFLSRPTLAKALGLGGGEELAAARRDTLWRLQRDKLLERVAHGGEIGWRLTAAGRKRLAELRNAPQLRRRRWDGQWRLVMFDFPEASRKQRDAFRWWLRTERLGQLQKSVWVSAFPLSPELTRFLKEAAELNWILWFESPEKGPVADAEIARRAWPLLKLADDYSDYIVEFGKRVVALEQGRAAPGHLGRWRTEEVAVYEALLRRDPFLPTGLLPPHFPGSAADELHARFVNALVRASQGTDG